MSRYRFMQGLTLAGALVQVWSAISGWWLLALIGFIMIICGVVFRPSPRNLDARVCDEALSADRLKPPPTLEELLAKRGIVKDKTFGDYQDYIIDRENNIRPRLFRRGLLTEDGMHLVLNRVIPTRNKI